MFSSGLHYAAKLELLSTVSENAATEQDRMSDEFISDNEKKHVCTDTNNVMSQEKCHILI